MIGATDYRPVVQIFDARKRDQAMEMRPYLGEFDFSKLEKRGYKDLRMIYNTRKLPKDLAEAGKFLRACLIKDRHGRETEFAAKEYKDALGIPLLFEYPVPDEIVAAIFFPGANLDNATIRIDETHLEIPRGLYFNFTNNAIRAKKPISRIRWETGFPAKDDELNVMYYSQFKR
jgi:hypothetical protein